MGSWIGEPEVRHVIEQNIAALSDETQRAPVLVALKGDAGQGRTAALRELARRAELAEIPCARVELASVAGQGFDALPARMAEGLAGTGVFARLPVADKHPNTGTPWPVRDFKAVIKLAKRSVQRNSPLRGAVAGLLGPDPPTVSPGWSSLDREALAEALAVAQQHDPFELLGCLMWAADAGGLIVTCDDLDALFPAGDGEAAQEAGERLVALHDQLARGGARVSLWITHGSLSTGSSVRSSWLADRRALALALQGPSPGDARALFDSWRSEAKFAGTLAEGSLEVLEELALTTRSWTAMKRALANALVGRPHGTATRLELASATGLGGVRNAVHQRIARYDGEDPFSARVAADPELAAWLEGCRALFRLGAPRAAGRLLNHWFDRNDAASAITSEQLARRFGPAGADQVDALLRLGEHHTPNPAEVAGALERILGRMTGESP